MTRTHLSVRVIAWIGQFMRSADRIEELDCLIRACSDNKLGLGKITDIDDRRVVCIDPLVEGHVPRRSRLE